MDQIQFLSRTDKISAVGPITLLFLLQSRGRQTSDLHGLLLCVVSYRVYQEEPTTESQNDGPEPMSSHISQYRLLPLTVLSLKSTWWTWEWVGYFGTAFMPSSPVGLRRWCRETAALPFGLRGAAGFHFVSLAVEPLHEAAGWDDRGRWIPTKSFQSSVLTQRDQDINTMAWNVPHRGAWVGIFIPPSPSRTTGSAQDPNPGTHK